MQIPEEGVPAVRAEGRADALWEGGKGAKLPMAQPRAKPGDGPGIAESRLPPATTPNRARLAPPNPMCTLITLFRCHASAPLIVALNRDEFLGRPTRSPEFWEESPAEAPIVAGRDLQAGGTWFGIGRHVIAGLTNHRSPEARRGGPSSGQASRGELVVEALKGASADEAVERVMGRAGEGFGPFHLLISDGETMRWVTNRDGGFEGRGVEPGLHVLGNLGLDHEGDPVVKHLHGELAEHGSWEDAELERRLKTMLGSHGVGRPCVHYNEAYGTRSSALLWWGGANSRYAITEGPPCRSPWTDRSALLEMVGRRTHR